jgi:hypothetical protein
MARWSGAWRSLKLTHALRSSAGFSSNQPRAGWGWADGFWMTPSPSRAVVAYTSVILWTVSALRAAAHLYRSVGFTMVLGRPGRAWGVDVTEEKYELSLMSV